MGHPPWSFPSVAAILRARSLAPLAKARGFGMTRLLSWRLSLRKFLEHLCRVNGDEGAAAAGQDFAFFVEDFGHVGVLAAANPDFPALDAQGFVQRHRLEIFDGHFLGERDDVAELIHFAHGVVEDGGDDAAMAVAGRAGVTLAEAKAADEGPARFVQSELEVHAVGIVGAAREAVVLLHFDVGGVVAVNLAGHGEDCSVGGRGSGLGFFPDGEILYTYRFENYRE